MFLRLLIGFFIVFVEVIFVFLVVFYNYINIFISFNECFLRLLFGGKNLDVVLL